MLPKLLGYYCYGNTTVLLYCLYYHCYCHFIILAILITRRLDNLYRNWRNWWGRQRLYFGWT